MKPRMDPAPLTAEDILIWNSLWRNKAARQQSAMTWLNPMCDRRDADLMYLAQLWRRGQMVMDHTYAHNGPCGRFAIDAIRCGGDITGCV